MKDITPEDSIVSIFLDPWSAEQIAEVKAESARLKAIEDERQTAKNSAIAKLKKLGLTDDEIAALLP